MFEVTAQFEENELRSGNERESELKLIERRAGCDDFSPTFRVFPACSQRLGFSPPRGGLSSGEESPLDTSFDSGGPLGFVYDRSL
ncbi:hypothetical protein KIH39_07490 [Telmatocola sphagniphila]|uniref:Uncharacterized protein n=1 Tax=Telmatocola sphagniphila TaxID=1123043 RepID=A0A8E6B9R0_9BACT|nr:hypothetical protein [Telmatocola sphagniphila]QVL33741.1 hypothetical protein KIH39_07490 [Telmatocola sphagniphila]